VDTLELYTISYQFCTQIIDTETLCMSISYFADVPAWSVVGDEVMLV